MMIKKGIDEVEIIHALDEIYDPEIEVPITELGLIYRVEILDEGEVEIDFTATYPGCPAVDIIYDAICINVSRVPGVKGVKATVVWDPPWGPHRMSEEARFAMGYPV